MTVDSTVTIPVAVYSSLSDQMNIASSQAYGQCLGTVFMEDVLLLCTAPGCTLAVEHPQDAGEIVHVPYLEQADAISSRVGKQAITSGAARKASPENGTIRQYQLPQQLKIVLPRSITVTWKQEGLASYFF